MDLKIWILYARDIKEGKFLLKKKKESLAYVEI